MGVCRGKETGKANPCVHYFWLGFGLVECLLGKVNTQNMNNYVLFISRGGIYRTRVMICKKWCRS